MKQNRTKVQEKQTSTSVFLLLVPVLLGTIGGSILSVLHSAWTIWDHCLFQQGMGLAAVSLPIGSMLLRCVLIPLLWLLFFAALGLSAAGAPAAMVLLVLRGAALGSELCKTYVSQGMAGILTAMVFVMPYAFLSTLLFVVAAREVLRNSWQIAGCVFRCSENCQLSLKLCGIRYLVLAAALLVLGLLQCCLLRYGYPVLESVMLGE